ncbi:hypothetical protein B0J13DRAFT_224043 [Dactylonectria estremocensis]|uniref:Uncharacterized protein n=1 Tax=Dactylonectria estremocensis TaxID=1079267 RepID=A0A9P9F8G8_9HYPO|nr:hypothetical protein B0J13DRAFT_224043 [Dactylonectria estremocensis]
MFPSRLLSRHNTHSHIHNHVVYIHVHALTHTHIHNNNNNTAHTAIIKPKDATEQLATSHRVGRRSTGCRHPSFRQAAGRGRNPSPIPSLPPSLALAARSELLSCRPAAPYYHGLDFPGRNIVDRAASRNRGRVAQRLQGAGRTRLLLYMAAPVCLSAVTTCISALVCTPMAHRLADVYAPLSPFQPYQSASAIARGSQTETTKWYWVLRTAGHGMGVFVERWPG